MQYENPLKKNAIPWSLVILYCIYAVVQLTLYFKIGIVNNLEADKYIYQANQLSLYGSLSDPKYFFYFPEIFLIWLANTFGLSYAFVIFIHCLLGGLGLYHFFRLCQDFCRNDKIAFFSTLALILFIPLQSWNFYLYSDSIFISLAIIFYRVVYNQIENGRKGVLLILAALTILLFSRPVGIFFIPAVAGAIILKKQASKQRLVYFLILLPILLAGIFIPSIIYSGNEDMDTLRPFREEHVLCYVPLKPEGANVDMISSGNQLNDLLYYISHNPLHFLKLVSLRVISFFNMVRPHYSLVHNIFLIAFMIPIYTLAIVGLCKIYRRFQAFFLFSILLLIFYPLGTALQCDEWHSRFTMPLIPLFILLASTGLQSLISKNK